MNIREYIDSGIVASYVLGLASAAEKEEFESLRRQYPELAEAVRLFELALEAQLMSEAVAPPPDLKNKILLSLNTNQDSQQKAQTRNTTPLRQMNTWKLVAAACIVLLCGSIFFSYSTMEKYKKLQVTNSQVSNDPDSSTHIDDVFKKLDPIVQKPSTKWSAMLDQANSSHCMAHVYWDTLTTSTYLLVGNIPKTISDKQFQLWAMQDNHPINLGIFDSKKEGQLIHMKNVDQAKLFVITIEQKGGSSIPTMEAIYATGKL